MEPHVFSRFQGDRKEKTELLASAIMLALSPTSLWKSSASTSPLFPISHQALVHSLGKGVEKLILLPSAIHTGKTQETAQFAVWEGISSEGRGHKLAMDAEETTPLLQPQK